MHPPNTDLDGFARKQMEDELYQREKFLSGVLAKCEPTKN